MLLKVDVQAYPIQSDLSDKLFGLLQDKYGQGRLESEIERHLYASMKELGIPSHNYVVVEIISIE